MQKYSPTQQHDVSAPQGVSVVTQDACAAATTVAWVNLIHSVRNPMSTDETTRFTSTGEWPARSEGFVINVEQYGCACHHPNKPNDIVLVPWSNIREVRMKVAEDKVQSV